VSQALAAFLAATGVGALLVFHRPAARRIGALLWVAGTVWLALRLLHSSVDRVGTEITAHPLLVGPALVVGGACLVAAAAVVHRWPWVFAIACVLAAPVRIPIHFGTQDAKLLVPRLVAVHPYALGKGAHKHGHPLSGTSGATFPIDLEHGRRSACPQSVENRPVSIRRCRAWNTSIDECDRP